MENSIKKLVLRSCVASAIFTVLNAPAVAPLPVWEYLLNQKPLPVPVMTNIMGDVTDSDYGDGKAIMSTLGSLKRYDANRLLLGVRENGVDETAANLNADQKWIAANYPDRSLIWIDANTGKPTGIALTVGLYPVPIPDWFRDGSIAASNNDYTNQYYWSYDVSEEGSIYTGYKNMVLRYAPNGTGGINPTPRVVFTLTPDINGVPVAGNLYTANGRFPVIRVRGTGTNTVILAGGMSGNRGAYRLYTTNGVDFSVGAFIGNGWGKFGSGSFSQIVLGKDPEFGLPGEEWVYGSWYPGSSNGADSTFGRMAAYPPFEAADNNFGASTGFSPKADPSENAVKFKSDFIGSVAAKDHLGYVVAYSTPSWNTAAVASGVYRPGWLGVLDATNGQYVASYKLNVLESDALLTTDKTAKWEATMGNVDLNTLPNGDTELLWSSPIYGYGRYLMKSYISLAGFKVKNGLPTMTVLGDSRGQMQRATRLENPDWTDVGAPIDPGVEFTDDAPPANSPAFYRMVKIQ